MYVNFGRVIAGVVALGLLVSVAASRAGGRQGLLAGLPATLCWMAAGLGVVLVVILVIVWPGIRTRRDVRRRHPDAVVFNSSRNSDGLRVFGRYFARGDHPVRRFTFTVMIDDCAVSIFTTSQGKPSFVAPLVDISHVEVCTINVATLVSVPALRFRLSEHYDGATADFVVAYEPSLDVYGLSYASSERLSKAINARIVARGEHGSIRSERA